MVVKTNNLEIIISKLKNVKEIRETIRLESNGKVSFSFPAVKNLYETADTAQNRRCLFLSGRQSSISKVKHYGRPSRESSLSAVRFLYPRVYSTRLGQFYRRESNLKLRPGNRQDIYANDCSA